MILYEGNRIANGADGAIPYSSIIFDDGCCPVICESCYNYGCSFLDLLPNGPMWDRQKLEAQQWLSTCGCDGEDEDCIPPSCPSLAMYAVYNALLLHQYVEKIMLPSILEANPATANVTLDTWLERLGWIDCYRNACRNEYTAQTSPYECLGPCGGYYADTNFSDEFETALKYGIVRSLARAARGGIKNLAWLNWVIEPLGAIIYPRQPWPEDVQDMIDNPNCPDDDGPPPCFCRQAELEICSDGSDLPLPSGPCEDQSTVAPVQEYACPGEEPVEVYPGVVAAECIVKSLLRRSCPNIIYRCP